MKLYYANLSYGKPNLSKLHIKKETSKMFILDRTKEMAILGYGTFRSQYAKDNPYLFDSPEHALEYLLDRLDNYRKSLEDKTNQIDNDWKLLNDLLQKMRESNELG